MIALPFTMKASKEDAFIFMFGSDAMTMDEASRQYRIPIKVLKEYERWGLCGAVKKVMGAWQYDDTDIRRLSTIMTLHDVGFTSQEVETYMRLLLEQGNTDRDRLRMLDEKRKATLDDIHFREKQLDGWTTCAMSCGNRQTIGKTAERIKDHKEE